MTKSVSTPNAKEKNKIMLIGNQIYGKVSCAINIYHEKQRCIPESEIEFFENEMEFLDKLGNDCKNCADLSSLKYCISEIAKTMTSVIGLVQSIGEKDNGFKLMMSSCLSVFISKREALLIILRNSELKGIKTLIKEIEDVIKSSDAKTKHSKAS